MLLAPAAADDSDSRSPSPPIARPALSSSTSGSRQTGLTNPSTAPKPNGALFTVFSDESGPKGAGDREGDWQELGTRDERRRENTREATQWRGERLPMLGGSATQPAEKLEVFRDEVSQISLCKERFDRSYRAKFHPLLLLRLLQMQYLLPKRLCEGPQKPKVCEPTHSRITTLPQ